MPNLDPQTPWIIFPNAKVIRTVKNWQLGTYVNTNGRTCLYVSNGWTVDYPMAEHPDSDLALYDRPELVPKYAKEMVRKYLRENIDMRAKPAVLY